LKDSQAKHPACPATAAAAGRSPGQERSCWRARSALLRLALAGLLAGLTLPCRADDTGCDAGWIRCAWRGALDIWDNGRSGYLFSGYAYHDRSTYTADKLHKLNEGMWGLGYMRSIESSDHRVVQSLYAMVMEDSDKNAQWQIGYDWQRYWGPERGLQGGLGFTAFVFQRPDIAHGIPVPGALPEASLRFGPLTLSTMFVPKLGGGVNHGNVVYFFGHIDPDRWSR